MDSLALRRDQAAAALLFLSGMRAGALVSLPISAVDMTNHAIHQLATLGVRTKNGKSAVTYLLPIHELLDIVHTWDAFIRGRLPASAMCYTPVAFQHGDQCLSAQAAGTHRRVALGKRLRHLCRMARVPFQSAHKFRHGHAVWALQQAETMADYKAISQNLMHANISITDGIYAMLRSTDVRQRITHLRPPSPSIGGSKEESGLSGSQLVAVLRGLADQISAE
jgi:integrase